MDELGFEARALIEQALDEERRPDAERLDQIRRHVLASAATAGVLLGAGEAAAVAGKSHVALLSVAAKGALLGTAVAVASYSLDRALTEPQRPSPVHQTTRSVAAVKPAAPRAFPRVAQPAEASNAVTAPMPADQSPSTAPKAPSVAAGRDDAARSDELGRGTAPGAPPVLEKAPGVMPAVASMPISAALLEESALLKRVQEALRAGHGREALRLLDASPDRLKNGQLRQERLAAEVLAACQIGEVERARGAARRFLAENPATPSTARLAASCVGDMVQGR